MSPDDLKDLVRTIPDFPKAGIQFRDITTLLGHGEAIAGMEARGFIFGAAVAARLRLPFLPIRKPGKLPCAVIGVDYELEYGLDRLEMDPLAVAEDQKVAIVDDLLATGGTALAATELLRKAGARVEDAAFVIDLPDLGGSGKLARQEVAVHTLMGFEGD